MPNAQPEVRPKQDEALPHGGQDLQMKTPGTGKPWWMRSRQTEECSDETKDTRTANPEAFTPEFKNVPIASSKTEVSRPWTMAQKVQEIFGLSTNADIRQLKIKETPTQPTKDVTLDKAKYEPPARRNLFQNMFTVRSYIPPSVEKENAPAPKELPLSHEHITPSEKSSAEPSFPHGMGTSRVAVRRRRRREREQENNPDTVSCHSFPQSSSLGEDALTKQMSEGEISPITPTNVDSLPSAEHKNSPDPISYHNLPQSSGIREGRRIVVSKRERRRQQRERALLRATFGRNYTTDARSYQANLRQSSDDSNGSLARPIEHAISPLPLAQIHESDSVDQASMDETVRESAIDFDVSDSAAPKFWSHSSEKSPGGEKLVVHYCRTLQNTEEIAKHFLDSKVLGFDMEWKSSASAWDSIQNNVSVIQIANEERIAIFQIASFKPSRSLKDLVSPTLKQIIESPYITKVGVSIKADCTRLRKYLGVDAKASFELSHLFKLVKYGQESPKLVNKRGVNLSDQMEEHFGLPLEKNEDVRCGDWARALSYRQVQYAATDPYACIRLYNVMEKKRLAMNPMPPRPAFAELNKPIILPLGQAVNGEQKEPIL
ncbi:hypothetical protein N7508_003076 [Penicillium antarcticum]|uniref:uncharacterized protein n=1 Tax=Penicillium antarcticum TaxID=416450 RepID=UPI00238F513D|nr:uncharacterized protein N7508_003076 [Penicillium antarcticum]KAJ5312246.1 hypothetical protein N7508_003076 [Penicillium antarcticum]